MKVHLQVPFLQYDSQCKGPCMGVNCIETMGKKTSDNLSLILGSKDCNVYAYDPRKEEYYPGFGVEHTGWINTVAAINDSYFLTGSNDTSIKLWSLKSFQNKGFCSAIHSYMVHTDYVQKITVPRFNRDTFYSIALDKTVRKWDLNSGKADDLDPALIHLDVGTLYCGNNYSSYSLACDEKGHVVAFGSPEKIIRILDVKSQKYLAKLSGHQDNIRDLHFEPSKSHILYSASSDGTIKKWDLRNLRAAYSWDHHKGSSIWSMCLDENNIYSGDKNGRIMSVQMNELNSTGDDAKLLSNHSKNGIFQMALDAKEHRLVVARNSPNLELIKLDEDGYSEITSKAIATLNVSVTADKRFVLYDECPVAAGLSNPSKYFKYDMFTGNVSSLKDRQAFDELKEECCTEQVGNWTPSWFNVDCKYGIPKVTLEESSAFSSELYSDSLLTLRGADEESRINVGLYLLTWIFAHDWIGQLPSWIDLPLFQRDMSEEKMRIWVSAESSDYGASKTIFHTLNGVSDMRSLMDGNDEQEFEGFFRNSWIGRALKQHKNLILNTSITSVSKISVSLKPMDPAAVKGLLVTGTSDSFQLSAHPMLRLFKLVDFIESKFPGLGEEEKIQLYLQQQPDLAPSGVLVYEMQETLQSLRFRYQGGIKKTALLEFLYSFQKK